jgi:hypothetical protein
MSSARGGFDARRPPASPRGYTSSQIVKSTGSSPTNANAGNRAAGRQRSSVENGAPLQSARSASLQSTGGSGHDRRASLSKQQQGARFTPLLAPTVQQHSNTAAQREQSLPLMGRRSSRPTTPMSRRTSRPASPARGVTRLSSGKTVTMLHSQGYQVKGFFFVCTIQFEGNAFLMQTNRCASSPFYEHSSHLTAPHRTTVARAAPFHIIATSSNSR